MVVIQGLSRAGALCVPGGLYGAWGPVDHPPNFVCVQDKARGRAWVTDQAAKSTTNVFGPQFNNATIHGSPVYNLNLSPEDPESPVSSESSCSSSEDESDDIATDTFQATYKGFDHTQKWYLQSGRAVEDVLYEAYFDPKLEPSILALLRDWIIDLGNETMMGWFSSDEQKEIKDSVPKLPAPSDLFAKSLERFCGVRTTKDLRRVLRTTSELPPDTEYNWDEHFDSEWADMVIRAFVVLFDTPGQPLCGSHLEDWYSSQIWSPILDKCFLSLPGMSLERKESCCVATALRKNRNRIDTTMRAKSGPRLDGIIRTVEDDSYEYGGLEVARTFRGTSSTKWLDDSRKLIRALRDMLGRLHRLVDGDVEVVGKLQVVGIVTAGLALQLCRLFNPHGYVCLLKREKVHQVPSSVDKLQDLLLLLAYVVKIKGIIKECVATVKGLRGVSSPEDLYKEIMNAGGSSPVRKAKATLPWPADSP